MPTIEAPPDRPVTVFDIGGTYVRRGRWRPRDPDRLHEYSKRPSPTLRLHPGSTVGELRVRLVRDLCEAVPIEPDAVAGISFGAALDHRTGTVYASAPMWGPHDDAFDLRGALSQGRPDVQWHIVNDVTAALLHYASTDACRDRRKVLLTTVSTGIACRTIDRSTGEIPVDGCGLQGEIGHLPSRAAIEGKAVDLPCDCGAPDHVASFSSGPGLQRMAEVTRERNPEGWKRSALSAGLDRGDGFESALRRALDSGDAVAGALLAAAARPLAEVLTAALCLDPTIDRVALTGGVATGLGDHYRRSLVDRILNAGPYLTGKRAPEWIEERVVLCRADEANGLIGAGLAALSGAARVSAEERST
ncbi:ROK family protein [Glycomyces buryatensis]|uniref:ROK family protein n=1 Tax=Glycomyces buryatensis TaxID=2570927 RepID=A0A4S8QCZ3_9ACTN|nr:ROK family protein [Glycomyces buryatensis]THV42238.1 ROK family protein [Glycomyces buryatensis]